MVQLKPLLGSWAWKAQAWLRALLKIIISSPLLTSLKLCTDNKYCTYITVITWSDWLGKGLTGLGLYLEMRWHSNSGRKMRIEGMVVEDSDLVFFITPPLGLPECVVKPPRHVPEAPWYWEAQSLWGRAISEWSGRFILTTRQLDHWKPRAPPNPGTGSESSYYCQAIPIGWYIMPWNNSWTHVCKTLFIPG